MPALEEQTHRLTTRVFIILGLQCCCHTRHREGTDTQTGKHRLHYNWPTVAQPCWRQREWTGLGTDTGKQDCVITGLLGAYHHIDEIEANSHVGDRGKLAHTQTVNRVHTMTGLQCSGHVKTEGMNRHTDWQTGCSTNLQTWQGRGGQKVEELSDHRRMRLRSSRHCSPEGKESKQTAKVPPSEGGNDLSSTSLTGVILGRILRNEAQSIWAFLSAVMPS